MPIERVDRLLLSQIRYANIRERGALTHEIVGRPTQEVISEEEVIKNPCTSYK